MTWDVEVMPDLSYASVVNEELVETWTRYVVAPVEAFQRSVGVLETFVAPLAGETSVGAAGAVPPPEAVVKLHTLDQSLVPAEFDAFTRQ